MRNELVGAKFKQNMQGIYSYLRRRRSWGTPASHRRPDRPGPPSLLFLNDEKNEQRIKPAGLERFIIKKRGVGLDNF